MRLTCAPEPRYCHEGRLSPPWPSGVSLPTDPAVASCGTLLPKAGADATDFNMEQRAIGKAVHAAMTMPAIARHDDAFERLDAIEAEPEEAFDRVSRVAARPFAAPIALISFNDSTRRWVKSRIGSDCRELPPEMAYLDDLMGDERVGLIADTREDARFAASFGSSAIRFYAAAPLRSRDGRRVGTLAVVDRRPRPDVLREDAEHLAQLAAIIVDELELRAVERRLTSELSSRSLAES